MRKALRILVRKALLIRLKYPNHMLGNYVMPPDSTKMFQEWIIGVLQIATGDLPFALKHIAFVIILLMRHNF